MKVAIYYGKENVRSVNNAFKHLDKLHLTYEQRSIIGSGGYMKEDAGFIGKTHHPFYI